MMGDLFDQNTSDRIRIFGMLLEQYGQQDMPADLAEDAVIIFDILKKGIINVP